MIKYRMDLSDEKKEAAIEIALESDGNIRKRKIAVPVLLILGIVILFGSVFQVIKTPSVLGAIYIVIGILCLLLAFNAKSFQKFALKTFLRPGMGKIIGLPLRNMALWGSIYTSKGKIIN